MTNERPFPHERNHVSSAAVDPGPAKFPDAPTDRYGMNSVTKQCYCAVCTGSTFNGPPNWYTTYHQSWDTRQPGDDTYTDQGQGVSNPTFQGQNNPDPLQAGIDIAQTPVAVQPVQPRQDPTPRKLVAEGLRRLADRYVNNPNSVVDVVRLEPGSSGGFQVVIILETAELL